MSDFIDLHDEYRRNHESGIECDVEFSSYHLHSIAARAKGITAITAVLVAESYEDEVDKGVYLGNWIRSGLIEAANALACDLRDDIERHVERAAEAAAGAKKKGGAA